MSGTKDEMSGYLGRWLSMTTALGVYNHYSIHAYSAVQLDTHIDLIQ